MTTAPATMPIIRRVARRPLALRTASASATWSPASGAVPPCPSRPRRTGGAPRLPGAVRPRLCFPRLESGACCCGTPSASRLPSWQAERRPCRARGRLLPGGRGGRRFRLDQRQEVGDVTGAARGLGRGLRSRGRGLRRFRRGRLLGGQKRHHRLTEPVRLILPEAMTTSPRLSAGCASATSNTWRAPRSGQRILCPRRLGSSRYTRCGQRGHRRLYAR